MLQVSNEYLEKMKLFENNYEHNYTVKNITRDIDLSDLLTNNSLKISRFLRQANGTISPSKIELSLTARADIPDDILLKDFQRMYKEFKNKRWKDLIYEEVLAEFLVRKGDLIIVEDVFNGEKITVFTGNVESLSKTDTSLGREIRLRVDDNTIKGHDYTFSEDYSYENHYIYNSNDKEHSLLFLLCKKHLEFDENKLQIQDIKNTNGEHIIIPLATFKKGTKIMSEIGELVRSFYGNIYTMPDGSLKINTIFDKSYIQKLDITLGNKKGNYPVLEFIENTPIHPSQNKVEVKYSNLYALEEQEVFKLSGRNATTDDAKIIIRSNTVGQDWWKIEFKDVIDVKREPIIEAYRLQDNVNVDILYSSYELEWNNGNARVKFHNPNNYDIYIKKFAFIGKPINQSNENAILYTENINLNDKNTHLKTVSYKYIVSKLQATEIAKHTYYNECRSYDKVRLKTNNMPFLELEDVINLDFKKYNGKYQIIAINQSHEDTELVLKRYNDYEGREEFIISEISNVNFDSKLISNSSINKEQLINLDEVKRSIEELKEKIRILEDENNVDIWERLGYNGQYTNNVEGWKKILLVNSNWKRVFIKSKLEEEGLLSVNDNTPRIDLPDNKRFWAFSNKINAQGTEATVYISK